MNRIFARLFLSVLLVTGVVLAFTVGFTYRQLDSNYQAEANQSHVRLAGIVAKHFQALWPLDGNAADRICKDLLREPALRLTVIALDGTVLGDSNAEPARMANHRTPDRPEVLAALGGHPGANVHKSATTGETYRYVALPIRHDGNVAAAVRLAVPIKAVAEGERFIRNTVLWVGAAGMAVAAALGAVIAWIWLGPLRRIVRTARQFAAGDLASEDGRGPKEHLTDLAESLGALGTRLGVPLGQLAVRHQDLRTVLASLEEGVAATDAEGRILFMNLAAEALLSFEPGRVGGTHLATFLPSADMQDFLGQALASEGQHTRLLEVQTDWGPRRLEFRAAGLAPGPSRVRCLLTIRDVTGENPAGDKKET